MQCKKVFVEMANGKAKVALIPAAYDNRLKTLQELQAIAEADFGAPIGSERVRTIKILEDGDDLGKTGIEFCGMLVSQCVAAGYTRVNRLQAGM